MQECNKGEMAPISRTQARSQARSQRADAQMSFAIDNTHHLHNVLKTLLFKDTGVLSWSEDLITIALMDFKCIQGIAYLKREQFRDYRYQPPRDANGLRPPEQSVKLNVAHFTECLNMLGSGPQARVSAEVFLPNAQEELSVQLEEDGVICTSRLRTMETDEDDLVRLEFDQQSIISTIIMKGEDFRDAFAELECSGEFIDIIVGEPSTSGLPGLQLSASSPLGSCIIRFDRNPEVVEQFACAQSHRHRYRITLLKRSYKVMQIASKVKLETDEYGYLRLQFMVTTDFDREIFVEFTVNVSMTPLCFFIRTQRLRGWLHKSSLKTKWTQLCTDCD